MQVSQYEEIAQSFLNEHPVGTTVSGSALQKWVAEHADGAALKPDLGINDPGKRINAIRRHLNNGGSSDSYAEDRRFTLQVEDAKRKTYIVRSCADVAKDQADGALFKSASGALSPLKRSQKAINNIKLDELPEIERQAMEMARENLDAMEKAVKPTYAQEVGRIWEAKLAQLGIPADQAKKIREALPQVTKLQKLLRATA
jgi:hypothetical protein